MVQNALGYVASLAEAVKNTFNFSVPFLSWCQFLKDLFSEKIYLITMDNPRGGLGTGLSQTFSFI
jgi:hypothetical protein